VDDYVIAEKHNVTRELGMKTDAVINRSDACRIIYSAQ